MVTGTSIRKWLIIAVPAVVVQLIIFKLYYPYASFFYTDSFSYLYAAVSNQDVNTWPIGYSKFLRIFNTFIHSDTGLVAFQYFFLQACGCWFLFTLFRLFRPGRTIAIILFIIIVFNPLELYLANAVSSDALFIGLSLLWMGLLLRMMESFSWRRTLVLCFILLVAFSLRFIAFYYPLVTIAGIILARASRWRKAIAIAFSLILPCGFLLYTAHASEELTGVYSFSAFGGWQMANNAIYGYNNVPAADRRQPPARMALLDNMVRTDVDAEKYRRTLLDNYYPGDYYLWSEKAPLIKYERMQEAKTGKADDFNTWSKVSPLYGDYGAWLIRQYPSEFLLNFCWPNTIRYALPPLEFMGAYNSSEDSVQAVAKYWFRYKSNKVHAFSTRFQGYVLHPYSLLNLVLNLFFLGSFFLFVTTKGMGSAYPLYRNCLILAGFYWLVHAGCSIITSPVVLRYQVFLSTLNISFSLLTIQYLLYWDKTYIPLKGSSNEDGSKEKPLHRGRRRVLPDLIIRLRGLR